MAAAAASLLASSEEETNGAKLSRLLIKGGTTVLKNIFDHYHRPANLKDDLNANYVIFKDLLAKKVLSKDQWYKLFPRGRGRGRGRRGGADPNSNTFDISLLFILLTNICGLIPPRKNWNVMPYPGDPSKEANIIRLKQFRNDLYAHVTTTGVDTHRFSSLWQEVSAVLVALGLRQSEIDRLKAEHCGEKDYLDILFKWVESEKDIKSKLDEVLHIERNVQQVVTEIHQSQLNTDQGEEILKKLAQVDMEEEIKFYAERYLEGTRESIFAKVKNWLDDRSSPSRVMVIIGNAGMGKSVIAAELCKKMQGDGRLSGSHFCQHNKALHRNPKVMLQSLAYHLSCSLPEYKNALIEQLSRNWGLEVNDVEVGDLFKLLFKKPLSGLSDPGFTSLVVIDALDESEYQGRNELLDVIAKYFNELPLWIRFLITTRPEINIWDSLKSLQPLQLKPNDEENLKDIRHIFEQQLSHVLQDENLELIIQRLVQKSEGLMLWAQLLVDSIKENFPILTLEHLDSTVLSGISSVYQSRFKRLETELFKELKITEEQFLSLLGVITAARDPLPHGFVSKLFFPSDLSFTFQRKVNKAIACISSLLPVQDGCIHFFHKSVKDWLSDKSLYGQHDYSVDEHKGHRVLSSLCIDEFNEVKQKGVKSSQQLNDTTKYALQHGVQHMLELDEENRPCNLEEIIKEYVIDVALVYAKLCVNVTAASEDIVCVNKYCTVKHPVLASLLFLLRKYSRDLKELPHVIFQALLNEGEPELCSQASNLLQNKYSDITYMEYLHKNDLQGSVQTTFHCSSDVACFDVSPRSDYMVCECRDGTIQLWSLHTGKLIWERPVIEGQEKRYLPYSEALRTFAPPSFFSRPLPLDTFVWSFFRSVVFHPTEDVILPGVLSHVYTFNGDLNRLFTESDCSFSVCSISGDRILTDCPNDAKCLIMWSLENGKEMDRTTRDDDVLTFAWSRDGRLLAISHSTGSVCLVDAMNHFQILAEKATPNVCGMIKFSPDHRFLYCCHYPLPNVEDPNPYRVFCVNVDVENHENISLDDESDENDPYDPWKSELRSEGGFTLGDPLGFGDFDLILEFGSFVFVLNEQSILIRLFAKGYIAMLSPDKLMEDPYGEVHKLVLSVNGETVYLLNTGIDKEFDVQVQDPQVTAWDVSNGELAGESTGVTCGVSLVHVREGILLSKPIGKAADSNVEQWNSGLSKCIREWCVKSLTAFTEMIPISDERVVCATLGDSEVTILDTLSGDMSRIQLPGGFIACNSKCQLITTSDSHPHSMVLLKDQTVLWEKYWPLLGDGSVRGIFSPTDHFLVISGRRSLFVLEGFSGKTLHRLWEGNPIIECKFVSDEECVFITYEMLRENCIRLFNVRSGQQLSLLFIDYEPWSLASCPGKGLIAFISARAKSKFRVVQIKMAGKNKDGKKNKRSAESSVRSARGGLFQ